MILKQMAVDSMRHADILTALVHVLENGEDASQPGHDTELIAGMSRFETSAEEQKLTELPLGETKPAIKALPTSINIDEEKHETPLKITLEKQRSDWSAGLKKLY